MTNEIVIDIETIPYQNLSRELLSIAEQKIARKKGDNRDIDKFCSLNAEFGQIVCIGIGSVLDEAKPPHFAVFTKKGNNEREILEYFWNALFEAKNTKIITFNGKGFDIPYILKRSAILGVLPSMKISTRRYDTMQHFDVMETLTNFFQGEMFSLGTYCKLYGIAHDDSVSGGDVFALWKAGNIEAIKAHCTADVQATWELYQKIKNYF